MVRIPIPVFKEGIKKLKGLYGLGYGFGTKAWQSVYGLRFEFRFRQCSRPRRYTHRTNHLKVSIFQNSFLRWNLDLCNGWNTPKQHPLHVYFTSHLVKNRGLRTIIIIREGNDEETKCIKTWDGNKRKFTPFTNMEFEVELNLSLSLSLSTSLFVCVRESKSGHTRL